MKKYWLLIASMMATSVVRAELVVEAAYVRALVPGASSTAAYMTLRNTGDSDVVIKAVKSTAAAQVTIHSTMNHSGMMHMMAMDSLKIAAKKSLVLEPSGVHLMLEKPTAAIAEGSMVELTLQLSDGTTQTLSLPVKSVLNEK